MVIVTLFPNAAGQGKPQYAKADIQDSTYIIYAIIPLVMPRFIVGGDSERYGYREAWDNWDPILQ